MAQTPAHIRAVAKYNAKNYAQILLAVPHEWRDKVKQAADDVGESMTKYIVTATEKRMEG